MKTYSRIFSTSLGMASLAMITASSVYGAGFYLPNQSTQATGRGNAWIATADSAAAVFYNPAGLSQLERPEIEAGLYGIQLGNTARIEGEDFQADREWQVIPNLYYAQPLSEKLAVGFGLYVPFGLGTDWGSDTPFRQTTISADIQNLRLTGALSYQVNNTLSLGAGISANYAEGTLRSGIFPRNNPATQNSDFAEFDGDDFAFSWNVGLLWKPYEKHSIGLSYRSKAEYDLRGDLSGLTPTSLSASLAVSTPEVITAGYAYQVNDRLSIEANIEWVNWERVDAFNVESAVPLPSQELDWKPTFIYAIGMSYVLNDTYTLHCGYDFNEGAQTDPGYTPALADADRHWINLGLTYHGETLTWDFGYQYGFSNNEVSNANNPAVNGRYESDHHALLISTRYTF